jgi:peptidoglycan hydrolase-like protein with peptidoglycan-binding domain
VQLAASEGSAKSWDVGALGGLLGSGFGGVGGGYSNTAEGKVIVAAFMDSYNGVVRAVRNYKAQHVKGGLGTGGNLGVQGAGGGHMSLKDAQARLNALGYPVGKPDGIMGRHTRSQLRRFQKAHHLAATGRLDAGTIEALRAQ